MKKGLIRRAIRSVFLRARFSALPVAVAQEQKGDWPLTGADAGQSGWQKDEFDLTPENIAANFKFLWKIKLGQPTNAKRSFSEPLLAGRLINAQGFKDIVYWSSADTLYAVDSELGSLVWKQEFKSPSKPAPGCEVSSLADTDGAAGRNQFQRPTAGAPQALPGLRSRPRRRPTSADSAFRREVATSG